MGSWRRVKFGPWEEAQEVSEHPGRTAGEDAYLPLPNAPSIGPIEAETGIATSHLDRYWTRLLRPTPRQMKRLIACLTVNLDEFRIEIVLGGLQLNAAALSRHKPVALARRAGRHITVSPSVPLMTESAILAVAETLRGRFTLERELGRGGMGLVFVARDVRHNRLVALKVLRPEFGSVVGAKRFLREIQLAAQLQHPNIVPVYESGDRNGTLYYVMPYVEGESLQARLRRESQLPLNEALQIARGVADALAYAHDHGVVHRDIKPENILLAAGHALVVDFGIARAITAAGTDRLTETGLVLGTPAYMSPEQSSGNQVLDARTDVYSLGCVVYEMLAGEPPYTATTSQALIAKRLSEPIPHLRTVREGVPEAVEQAVTKALAKVPADRFQTARAFAAALVGAPFSGTDAAVTVGAQAAVTPAPLGATIRVLAP